MIPAGSGPELQVAIAPVPTVVTVGQGTGPDGATWVLLFFDTQQGRQVFHLQPAIAKTVGETLVKFGAAGQLIVGSNGNAPGG